MKVSPVHICYVFLFIVSSDHSSVSYGINRFL